METACVHFRVSGRVQGVGFRAYVRELAESLGVGGGVWNVRDGAVEGDAHGPEEVVGEFVRRLWLGPGHVHDVSQCPTHMEPGHSGFTIESTR